MIKRILLILCVAAALLHGTSVSAQSPISPSQGYYVSDYASTIYNDHSRFILETAPNLYKTTGVQVLVLAVQGLDGFSREEYAERVYSDWWNTGKVGAEAVLLILSTADKSISVTPYGDIANAFPGNAVDIMEDSFSADLEAGKLSSSLLACYKQVVLRVYSYHGVQPNDALLEKLNAASTSDSEGNYYLAVALVLGLLVIMRGLFVSRKYHKKYGGTPRRQRKDFTIPRRIFDDDSTDIVDLDE